MEESTKLALAVVAAAVILIGGYVAYSEYARARDVDQAKQALDSFRQNAQQAVADTRHAVQVSEQQQAVYQQQAAEQWRQHERYRLALDQRCVGDAVVQVRGSTYTQLGTIAQPVRCSGEFADQPLR